MEIEVKFKIDDFEKIRENLEAINAEFDGVENEEDHYLEHPCRDFYRSDEALRVRILDDKTILTYKGPRKVSDYKIREEVESLTDPNILEILKKLDFVEIAVIKKRREKYRFENVNILLDDVYELGKFVELEVFDEMDTKKIDYLIEKLSLDKKEKRTYLEIYLGDRNGL